MTLPLLPGPGPFFDADLGFELRPYQKKAVALLRKHVKEGKKRILLVAPTGAGKMTLISSIIRTSKVPVIFMAHRAELINQCVKELRRQRVTNVGVIRASDKRANPDSSVQICSIQTLVRRQELPNAGIIFIDEAHRAPSDSYVDVVSRFPDAILLGFTATPWRLDKKPLGDVFEILEEVTTYSELIKLGYIVAPKCFSSPIKPDLSDVQVVGGDYDEDDLSDVMCNRKLIGNLVEHWTKHASQLSTFVFAVSVRHSMLIKEEFVRAGISIEHLDGETPEKQRLQMLEAMSNGEIQIITNCNVLLEGVDIPRVKCVVHARPTNSLTLYRQSAGRILRPWNGVTPIFLDHAGNFDEHGAPHEDICWSLTTEPVNKSKSKYKTCKHCFAQVQVWLKSCISCGAPFLGKPIEIPEHFSGELRERVVEPEFLRKEFYDKQVSIAHVNHHKPGFASIKYLERYGQWPPRSWSQQTIFLFKSDLKWQIAVAEKIRRKQREKEEEELQYQRELERWEGTIVEVKPEPAHYPINALPPYVQETTSEIDSSLDEEDFQDWLNRQ